MSFAIRYRSLALLVLVGLTGCGGQPQQIASADPVVYQLPAPEQARSDFVGYSDEEYPFTIQLPRDWYAGELSEPAYGIVAANTNQPGQPRAAISVVAEPLEGDIALEEAVAAAEETLRAQPGIGDFRLELDRPATVNGREGRERSYRFTSAGQAIRQRTIYLKGSESLYAVSLTAPQDIFAQHEAIFNDVLITFQGS